MSGDLPEIDAAAWRLSVDGAHVGPLDLSLADLRARFPEATVERLVRLQWWRYSIFDLFGLPFDRIDETLDGIEAKVEAFPAIELLWRHADRVTARVRHRNRTTVPIVGRLVGDVTVEAVVVMQREQ